MTPHVWRAMVVDDNAINLEVAVSLLQQLGLQTDGVSGGEQAVTQALAVTYDLIVMDVQMPGMDGIEATRRIRLARGRLPPIIALTANAEADDRSACLQAGMNDYLTKPVMPELLRGTLQRWLPDWPAGAAPSSPATTPHDSLANIEGFDLAGSLQNLGGQRHRLERVLLRFAATYRAGEPALMQAASRGDVAALWQACHSLRGACAVLCANRLVEHIEALEAVLENNPERNVLLDKVRALQSALVALARQLEAALGTG
jgi:CheY-like chemotaxis protein